MINMIQMIQALQGAMRNPAEILQRMGLPADAMQNPQAAVQMLMNNGKMNQQQFNSLQQTAKQIMGNPMFAQLFGK